MNLHTKLRNLRKSKKLTLQQVARDFKIPHKVVTERIEMRPISLSLLAYMETGEKTLTEERFNQLKEHIEQLWTN